MLSLKMSNLFNINENIDEKENNGNRRTRSSKSTFPETEKISMELSVKASNSNLDIKNVLLNPKIDSIVPKKNFLTLRSKVSPKQQGTIEDNNNECPGRSTKRQPKTPNNNQDSTVSSPMSETDLPATPKSVRSSGRNSNSSKKLISPRTLLSTNISEKQSELDEELKGNPIQLVEEPKAVEKDVSSPQTIASTKNAIFTDNVISTNAYDLNVSIISKSGGIIESSEQSPKQDQKAIRRSLRAIKKSFSPDKGRKSFATTKTPNDSESNNNNNNNNAEESNLNEHIELNDESLKESKSSELLNDIEYTTNNNLEEHASFIKSDSMPSVVEVTGVRADVNGKYLLENLKHEVFNVPIDTDHDSTIGTLDGAVVYNIMPEEKKIDENDSGHSSAGYGPNFHFETNLYKEEDVPDEYHTSSPSAESLDSAKGSSLANDNEHENENLSLYSTGDLYWAQIYKYCYWPCMVCPDPSSNVVQLNNSGRSLYYMVHVRFFADNGRRNWVKQENLLPFINYENFVQLAEEAKIKYGKRSPKYKLFVPTTAKKDLWMDAVREANIISETKYPERLEKFYSVFEKSNNFNKSEKKRRQSMYLNDSEAADLVNTTRNLLKSEKRERSISPTSPAFSPISHKRRKLTTLSLQIINKSESSSENVTENFSQPQQYVESDNQNQALEIAKSFKNPEFAQLHGILREYFLFGCQDPDLEKSLISGLKNLWTLREINRIKIARELTESTKETNLGRTIVNTVGRKGEGTLKRLSNRIKDLTLRRILHVESTGQLSESISSSNQLPPRSISMERGKKIVNRPIEEVIDDIFNLDNKYLFRGLQREPVCKYCFKPSDNLIRCSKKCMTWFHINCLSKPPNTVSKRGRHLKKKRTSLMSNKTESSEFKLVVSVEHITADDGVDNEEKDLSIQKTITAETPKTDAEQEIIEGEKNTCNECLNNETAVCCICLKNTGENEMLLSCQMLHCQKVFHTDCCKYWPHARTNSTGVRCPSHVCHTCVSDDPKGKFQHIANTKLVKCVKCPSSYHMDSTCIPAGSEILTAAHIICPRHHKAMVDAHLNVNWCYICANGGGDVLCCETCPFAVHEKCLNFTLGENELYICEECESGRMPLYGEMVWVKFNAYRWWPAIILPPTEVPANIMRKPHNALEFVVRFFGTHDHGWISRRRVYLYAEGDYSENPKSKSALDYNYNKGVEEAKHFFEIIKGRKNDQRTSIENKEKVHPQPYTKIKTNRPVPPVKLHVDFESVSKCGCSKTDNNPCARASDCINRALFHECNPKICPAGDKCENQMFEKRKSPRLEVVYMKERGFGLVTRENIKKDSFVIEYVGEIINDTEFQKRVSQKNHDRDENFYFLSVEKDYIIDAGPKGNLARFMNHSCDPNCETQKWSVNSINRVGLFAIKEIPANTELTFNYHWDELLGSEKKNCFCGAANCAGQIGAKLKQTMIKVDLQSKVKTKKRKSIKRLQDKTTITKLIPKLDTSHVDEAIKAGTVSIKSSEDESELRNNESAVMNSPLSPSMLPMPNTPKGRKIRRSIETNLKKSPKE